jgi:sentrin-specific protease 1
MLAQRDKDLCAEDPSRKRSHFFKSFFMTKLLNEGHATRSGMYEYSNVKRWSKKVPGKDIFGLEMIFFPINVSQSHWVCAVAFMQEKRIQFYDSMVSKVLHVPPHSTSILKHYAYN